MNMNRKFAIVALIGAVGMLSVFLPSCSDDDEPEPKTLSLATAYVMPTSVTVTDVTKYSQEERRHLQPAITFVGTTINNESNPAEFSRLNRFFGDTACTKNASTFWPVKKHTFVGKPVVGIKAIAADDTWGKNSPKGADVSNQIEVTFLSANNYIESGYSNPSYRKEMTCDMNKWQSNWGYSLCNVINICRNTHTGHDTPEDRLNCQGHRFDLIITFPDEQIEVKNALIDCFVFGVPASPRKDGVKP